MAKRTWKVAVPVAGATLAVLIAAVGTAVADDPGSGAEPTRQARPSPAVFGRLSTTAAQPAAAPATASDPASTLQGLVRQLADPAIVSVSVGPARRDVGPGLMLAAVVKADGPTDPTYLKATWGLTLIQGDLAESLAAPNTNLANVVSGMNVTVTKPNGSTSTFFSGASDSQSSQQFSRASDDTVTAEVSKIVQSYGFSVVDQKVLRLRDDALAVKVAVPSVAAASGKISALQQELVGNPDNYEGVYLEVVVGAEPIARVSTNARVGTSSLWQRPDLDGKLGLIHG